MNWKKVKLADVGFVQGGYAFPSSEYLNEGVPLIRISNINDDAIELKANTVFVNKDYLKSKPSFVIEKDDILIALSGATTGKFGIYNLDVPSLLNQRVGRIKLNFERIEQKYFFYFMFQIKNSIFQNAYGAAIPNISPTDIASFKIPLPPLSDQKRITAILDQADELRKKDQQILVQYDALLQSIFNDMFGDPVVNDKGWKKLNGEEYSEKISVGVVIQPASYYVEKGVLALRSLNIRPNEIVLNNLVYFSKEAHLKILSKSILSEGDVVIVRTGGTGTAAVVPKNLDGCNCIDLIIVKPNTELINPFFLSFFFNSDFAKKVVSGKEVGGIQKHFNIGAIKALKIPVPPVKLQNKFASIFQNIQQQKHQIKQQQQKSEDLFQTLLQKAFNGEIIK